MAGRPNAVFLDLLFFDDTRRGDVDALAAAIRRATTAGIEVLVASGGKVASNRVLCTSADERRPVVLPPIAAAAIDMPFVTSVGYGSYYPLVADVDCADGAVNKAAPALSPAAHLYLTYCRRNRDACASTDTREIIGTLQAPLSVSYGETTAAINRRIYANTNACPETDGSAGARLLRAGKHLMAGIFDRLLDPEAEGPCLYHAHAPAWLALRLNELADAPEGAVAETVRTEVRELREGLFTDKYVMVGLDLVGMNDVTQSPVHGQIPGVAKHAMALDNLITMGGGYLRPAEGLLDPNDLFEGGLLLVFALAAEFIRHRRAIWHGAARGQQRSRGDGLTLGWAAVCSILLYGGVFLLAWGFVTLLHLVPMNWLGVALAAIVFSLELMAMPARQVTDHIDVLAGLAAGDGRSSHGPSDRNRHDDDREEEDDDD